MHYVHDFKSARCGVNFEKEQVGDERPRVVTRRRNQGLCLSAVNEVRTYINIYHRRGSLPEGGSWTHWTGKRSSQFITIRVLFGRTVKNKCLQPLTGLSRGKGIKVYFLCLGRAKLEPMGGSFNRQISAQPKEGYSNN